VVIYDRLISPEILELARREALMIDVGKEGFGPSTSQETINDLLVEHASGGAQVVRLKSGDATVFGRLDEEIDAVDAHNIGWHIVAAEVLRACERNVHGYVVCKLGSASGNFDEHTVDASTALHVLVAVEGVAICGFDTSNLADADVLFQGDLEFFEVVLAIGDCLNPFLGNESNEGVGLGFEEVGASTEVGFALQFDDGTDVAGDDEADYALCGVAVLTLCAGCEAFFAEPGLGGFHVAVVLLQGFFAVHHAGAGGDAERLDVLCSE